MLSGGFSAHFHHRSKSHIRSQALEERMPHFALGRLRPILDLGARLRCRESDALAIGLRIADQRREASAERLGGLAIEAEVDLAGII
jgi:hypothetical protein